MTSLSRVPPHNETKLEYNSLSELRDLIIHMERFATGLKSGIYKPNDDDFQDLSTQIFSLAQQLKTFSKEKAQLVVPENMY